jgi:hypothetical protein
MKNMMRKKDDCYRCCVAELLDMPYENVPDFFGAEIENKYTRVQIFKRVAEWFEGRGLTCIGIPCTSDAFVNGLWVGHNMGLIGILKHEDEENGHAVVMRTMDCGATWDILDPSREPHHHFHDLCAIEVFQPIKINKNY